MSNPTAKHNEATALVQQMTLEEKAACASGRNFWHMQGCERLDLPAVMITDGPHGLRKQDATGDHVGLNHSVPSTCFPTACALAASWDLDLVREVGVALGEQCVAENVAVLLGPGMNIKRHPLCGRNFEYFSEDPLLNGEIAAAMIEGVQSQGVGTSVKHFAVNNQEAGRMYVDAIVDERTLREIYLRGFEIAVRKAQPWTVMCAYNRLNGTYCGENDWLLNQVLRNEWGFKGLVVTDWGATNDRVRSVTAGLDLEMPGSGGINDARIRSAVQSGALAEEVLDRMLVRNVSVSLAGADLAQRELVADHFAHHALALRAAAESAVLLKNDGDLLPMDRTGTVAVIGAFATTPRFQGTGSSQVNPTKLDTLLEALTEQLGADAVTYAAGYEATLSAEDPALIAEATQAAATADMAIVMAGLPTTYESEGFDRTHMRLPAQHDALVSAVAQANPNIVVVLSNGAPVEMPWLDQVPTVLEAYLGGQAGGSALAELLLGDANPSGKLAETFPVRIEDVPADANFPGTGRQVHYREGLYVGYRYFQSADAPCLFPFGHGLSYTTFEYSDLIATASDAEVRLSLKVRNAGERAGAEVVQVYAHANDSCVERPEIELRGFAKTHLEAGEQQSVEIVIPHERLAFYDVGAACWRVEPGTYTFQVGASCTDIRLSAELTITGDAPSEASRTRPHSNGYVADDAAFAAMLGHPSPEPEPTRPFHMNSALHELQVSFIGRQFRKQAVAQFTKSMGVDNLESSDPTLARMFEEMLNHMPLRSFALFSQGKVQFRQLELLIALMNHRYLHALRLALGGSGDWS